MSADNMIVIRNTTDGRFGVAMEFASAEYPKLLDAATTPEDQMFYIWSNAYLAAEQWLERESVVEYGIVDCSTGQPKDSHQEKKFKDSHWSLAFDIKIVEPGDEYVKTETFTQDWGTDRAGAIEQKRIWDEDPERAMRTNVRLIRIDFIDVTEAL